MAENDNVKNIEDLMQDPMVGALELMKRNMTAYIEYAVLIASLRRKAYDAYIEEGFTEAQSLILCQNMNLLG